MEIRFSSRPLRLFVVVATILPMIGCAQTLLAAGDEQLRILLTNDDGFDAPGIKAVYDALLTAGHEVTLVAPRTNQSASGTRFTPLGVLEYTKHADRVWAVDGSPGDAVRVGLGYILDGVDRPDVVVSGANFGPNAGYASTSGTVGAAITAMYLGIPAIAVSVGVDYSERDATPVRFPSTFDAFDGAAQLTVKILRELKRSSAHGERLLPNHTALNVNYPAVGTGEIKGVQITQAARSEGGFGFQYDEAEEHGKIEISVSLDPQTEESETNTDVEWLHNGYATVTVLDGDWDAGQSVREIVRRRLTKDIGGVHVGETDSASQSSAAVLLESGGT